MKNEDIMYSLIACGLFFLVGLILVGRLSYLQATYRLADAVEYQQMVNSLLIKRIAGLEKKGSKYEKLCTEYAKTQDEYGHLVFKILNHQKVGYETFCEVTRRYRDSTTHTMQELDMFELGNEACNETTGRCGVD